MNSNRIINAESAMDADGSQETSAQELYAGNVREPEEADPDSVDEFRRDLYGRQRQ